MDYTIVNLDELARSGDTYEFEGYQHGDGDAGVCVILVDMAPGEGPKSEVIGLQSKIAILTK